MSLRTNIHPWPRLRSWLDELDEIKNPPQTKFTKCVLTLNKAINQS